MADASTTPRRLSLSIRWGLAVVSVALWLNMVQWF